MAFSVNTNASALEALRQLNATTGTLEETQSRINTGEKVRTAADDPANFSIAQNLRGQSEAFKAVRSSLDRATSTTDIAINAAETISDLLIEARETTVAASDGGIDAESRKALSDEFGRLLDQINSVVSQAEFNGVNLVDESLTRITALTGTEVDVNDVDGDGEVGPGEANLINTIDINGRNLTTDGIGLTIDNFGIDPATGYDIEVDNLADVAQNLDDQNFVEALVDRGNADGIVDDSTNPAAFDFTNATFDDGGDGGGDGNEELSFSLGGETFTFGGTFTDKDDAVAQLQDDFSQATAANTFTVNATPESEFSSRVKAEQALVQVDDALNEVNGALAEFGAGARQLELATEFTGKLNDEIDIGIGNLVDADLAKESANLQSLQVKQQLGLQALGIANGQPQALLSLFGN